MSPVGGGVVSKQKMQKRNPEYLQNGRLESAEALADQCERFCSLRSVIQLVKIEGFCEGTQTG